MLSQAPLTSRAPAFLVKGSSSCSGRAFAHLNLGLTVTLRASSDPPYKHLEFGLAEDSVCATTSSSAQNQGVGMLPSLDYDPGFEESAEWNQT